MHMLTKEIPQTAFRGRQMVFCIYIWDTRQVLEEGLIKELTPQQSQTVMLQNRPPDNKKPLKGGGEIAKRLSRTLDDYKVRLQDYDDVDVADEALIAFVESIQEQY